MKKYCLIPALWFFLAGLPLLAPAQGLRIEIFTQPGFSRGGEFHLPESLQSSFSSRWQSMERSMTMKANIGANFCYSLNDKMGLSIGLVYSSLGQKFKEFNWPAGSANTRYDTTFFNREVKLNYLNIPVQFNYIFSPDQKISLMFSGGLYMGFLLSYIDENIISHSDGNSRSIKADGDVVIQTDKRPSWGAAGTTVTNGVLLSKPYESIDLGGLLCGGILYKLSDRISVPIMICYQFGLKDVKNNTSQVTLSNSSNAQLFWDNAYNNSPNTSLKYRNSSIGLRIGLSVTL